MNKTILEKLVIFTVGVFIMESLHASTEREAFTMERVFPNLTLESREHGAKIGERIIHKVYEVKHEVGDASVHIEVWSPVRVVIYSPSALYSREGDLLVRFRRNEEAFRESTLRLLPITSISHQVVDGQVFLCVEALTQYLFATTFTATVHFNEAGDAEVGHVLMSSHEARSLELQRNTRIEEKAPTKEFDHLFAEADVTFRWKPWSYELWFSRENQFLLMVKNDEGGEFQITDTAPVTNVWHVMLLGRFFIYVEATDELDDLTRLRQTIVYEVVEEKGLVELKRLKRTIPPGAECEWLR